MTTVIKGKKVNWSFFIFNHLVEKVVKKSTRKGYRLVLNSLMKRYEINMGNYGNNISKSKWLGATNLAKARNRVITKMEKDKENKMAFGVEKKTTTPKNSPIKKTQKKVASVEAPEKETENSNS